MKSSPHKELAVAPWCCWMLMQSHLWSRGLLLSGSIVSVAKWIQSFVTLNRQGNPVFSPNQVANLHTVDFHWPPTLVSSNRHWGFDRRNHLPTKTPQQVLLLHFALHLSMFLHSHWILFIWCPCHLYSNCCNNDVIIYPATEAHWYNVTTVKKGDPGYTDNT